MKYIEERIGDEYKNWRGKNVILRASTGMGKTSFLCKKFAPYCAETYKKPVLMLVNRKLLEKECNYNLSDIYTDYDTQTQCIRIMTYQTLANDDRLLKTPWSIFERYSAVICDEAHFVLADSDFNGKDTLSCLYGIIYGTLSNTLIFTSATMDQKIVNLIKFAINDIWKTVIDNSDELMQKAVGKPYWDGDTMRNIVLSDKNIPEPIVYTYQNEKQYDNISVCAVDDFKSLASEFAFAEGKSILFIDDKEKANEFKVMLQELNAELSKTDICLLSSDNIDNASLKDLREEMLITKKLKCKILVTTSVLDNGVNICDDEVHQVAIIAESKLVFLQMLGRVRSPKQLKLYLVKREASEFKIKMNQLEYAVGIIDEIEEALHSSNGVKKLSRKTPSYIQQMIDDTPEGKIYKQIFVTFPSSPECMKNSYASHTRRVVNSRYKILTTLEHREPYLALNYLAIQKIKDTYDTIRKLYLCSYRDPINTVYMQAEWIGKKPEEIIESGNSSSAFEREKAAIREMLLTVQDLTRDEFAEIKKSLSKYKRTIERITGNTLRGNDFSFSKETTERLVSSLGLRMAIARDQNRKNRYSINEIVNNDLDDTDIHIAG